MLRDKVSSMGRLMRIQHGRSFLIVKHKGVILKMAKHLLHQNRLQKDILIKYAIIYPMPFLMLFSHKILTAELLAKQLV